MSATARLSSGRRRRVVAAVASIVLVGGAMASTAAVASASGALQSHVQPKLVAPAADIGYAINKPLCSTTVESGRMNCFAMQRVPVKKGTPGAYPYLKTNTLTPGPAGGYTPADLAQIYAYNPNVNRTNQTVGIIDWFADATIKSDLKTFDTNYHLGAETAKSFRVVNQEGKKSPLPSSSKGKG
jgi:subtilase family serine protease